MQLIESIVEPTFWAVLIGTFVSWYLPPFEAAKAYCGVGPGAMIDGSIPRAQQFMAKLLNCPLCCGFWSGIGAGFFTFGINWNVLAVAFIASTLSEYIYKKLSRNE